MNRLVSAALLVLFGLFLYAPPSLTQQEQAEGARKIVSRVMPRYPDMARTMNITRKREGRSAGQAEWRGQSRRRERRASGAGTGGAEAIYRWKWEPAAHETREPIEVKFDPQ